MTDNISFIFCILQGGQKSDFSTAQRTTQSLGCTCIIPVPDRQAVGLYIPHAVSYSSFDQVPRYRKLAERRIRLTASTDIAFPWFAELTFGVRGYIPLGLLILAMSRFSEENFPLITCMYCRLNLKTWVGLSWLTLNLIISLKYFQQV